MINEVLNIANIKIHSKEIKIEFLYKDKKIDDSLKLYIQIGNKELCNYKIKKCENSVIYNQAEGEMEVAKITILLKLKEYGAIKLRLKAEFEIVDASILDNKGEEIGNKENLYVIFNKNYKIVISKNGFYIEKKKITDKLIYEIKKQIYGVKKYRRLFLLRLFKRKENKYYLFNDRLFNGDDNAEELFRYVNEKHPEFARKSYFVLEKDSKNIEKIKSIGNVLIYGSLKHKIKYINSRIVISSHASYYETCFNPFNREEMDLYKDIITKKFVFLQHGVIMNDVRKYHNRCLITADLFVTSTKKEYNYMKAEDLMYEPKMVIGTGLPRFDKLINKPEKVILISPTWRNYQNDISENSRYKEFSFENSEYYMTFGSLLTNNKLREILLRNNYKIKFLLHPVFSEYKPMFEKYENEYITTLSTDEIVYSDLFNECEMLITDYSSIHFDVATLEKPILYYQFDKEFFFKKHYSTGYFDYELDGFGEVIEKESELISKIDEYIKTGCIIKDTYKKRIEDTFIHLDRNNSQRVFSEIAKIDGINEVNYRFNNVH